MYLGSFVILSNVALHQVGCSSQSPKYYRILTEMRLKKVYRRGHFQWNPFKRNNSRACPVTPAHSSPFLSCPRHPVPAHPHCRVNSLLWALPSPDRGPPALCHTHLRSQCPRQHGATHTGVLRSVWHVMEARLCKCEPPVTLQL